ncbi:MAG: phage antirepressor protein [Bifidobacteriaceae bacterium]|jgi:hypothetical protein|nr:phage antirepressor protein [Bifidobacteriaceae bacterium]
MDKKDIKLFQNEAIRAVWDEKKQDWYISVVDVVKVLTDQPSQNGARNYWKVLKNRLKAEGVQSVTNCNQLKLKANDGKMRLTDVATPEQLLRIIQSIPSKKAEPFKLWLAEVGNDRLNEVQNPELTIERAMKQYKALGYSNDWINLRLQAIQIRKDLTDEWQKSGVKEGLEYAILTNILTEEWSGKTVQEYKKHKKLKKENLRDNMTNAELVLNMLAEVSTSEIHKNKKVSGFNESKKSAKQGGNIAKNARKQIEKQTGKSIVSSKNANKIKGRKELENG